MKSRIILISLTSLLLLLIPSCKNAKAQVSEDQQNQESEGALIKKSRKDFFTLQEYKKLKKGLNEWGGITFYDEVQVLPATEMPVKPGRKEVAIFGVDGDYMPPEQAYSQVKFGFDPFIDSDYLYIEIPLELYEKNPKVYLEARHQGKSFFYKDKEALNFSLIEGIGYRGTFYFVNRNLYSDDDEWTVLLRNCQDDQIVAQAIVERPALYCNYLVYSQDYQSPFIRNEGRAMSPNEKYSLIYMGRGSSSENQGDMLIISYGYNTGTKLLYLPILGVKALSDDGGICKIDFSIREPGQYKIDFYDCSSSKITESSVLDFITVSYTELKHVFRSDAEWTVNSPQGLRIRDSAWGEKIGLLENGLELVQTDEALFSFYDCIDGQEGFWIPVQIKDKEKRSQILGSEKKAIYSFNDQSDGWVFSAFLKEKNPEFDDYPARATWSQNRQKPILDTEEKKQFKSLIKEASKLEPNFNRKYRLLTYDCGTMSHSFFIINLEDGVVTPGFNFEINLDYRLDSSLLIKNSEQAIEQAFQSELSEGKEIPDWCKTEYYCFTGKAYREL